MTHFNKLFITATAVALFTACKPDKFDVDVSEIKVPEVKFMRFEKELFSITPQNIDFKTQELGQKYGAFYHMFVNTIRGRGIPGDTNALLSFVTNKDMLDAYRETQKIFSDKDIEKLEKELTTSVRRFHYFFPKKKLPKQFTTCMSGFDYNFAYPDSVMAVSLDMYLGSDNAFYKMLQWPNYQVRVLNKDHMWADIVRGWLITDFDNGEPVNDLIHNMIFYGRIFYACDALLPGVEDSVKIGYTTAQMNYCKAYEKNLWGFFAENNRLYESNMKTVTEFTSDGPFTSAISKECPPRIAMWTGWQIVRSYMEKNEKVTLDELMNEKDVLKILNKSKYRP